MTKGKGMCNKCSAPDEVIGSPPLPRAEGKPPLLVIGVGNVFRGDDGVGPVVARKVKLAEPTGRVRVAECPCEPMSLIEAWEGAEDVVVVDAVMSGAEAGTIFRFEVAGQPLPSYLYRYTYSTHDLDVSQAIEMARALGKLPPHLTVYGIEGESFGYAEGLTPEVERSAEAVVSHILDAVDEPAEMAGAGHVHERV